MFQIFTTIDANATTYISNEVADDDVDRTVKNDERIFFVE